MRRALKNKEKIREIGELGFVHIPKCGGVSLSHALAGREIGHLTVRDYEFAAKKEKYITIIRDPVDRVVSALIYILHHSRREYDRNIKQELSGDPDQIIFWLNKTYKKPSLLRPVHFRSFRYFLETVDALFPENISIYHISNIRRIENDFEVSIPFLNSYDKTNFDNALKLELLSRSAIISEIIESDLTTYNLLLQNHEVL